RPGIGKVGLVDHLHRPVDDRLFDGLQPRLAAHDELAEGQHEVGFQRQRVFFLGIVEVDVQGIYIVGAGRGQPDYLAAQPLHQGRILVLRVADDDIVLGHQHDKGDLPFAAHGFAAARRAEHKAVGTAGLLAVQQDHVVGEGIEAIVHGVAAHEHLLGDEGDEHRQGRSGQAPFNLDAVEAQRQRRHQPVLLLEVQPGQKTVVGLGDAGRLGHGDLQLLPGLRRVQNQKGHVEHSLVAGLQVGEKVLCRAAVGGKVGGKNVHIVTAAYRPLLLLYLHGVQVGDLSLDHFDGLVLVDAPDVHGH
ncbi:Thioredoxin reductase, partial [Dysosmobacter welbionis]